MLKKYNFQHFPPNLRGKKVPKGKKTDNKKRLYEAVREVICSPMQRLPIKHRPETQRDLSAQRLGEQGGETEAQDLYIAGCVIPREGEVQGDKPGRGREGQGPEGNACRGRGRLAQRRILCSRLPQRLPKDALPRREAAFSSLLLLKTKQKNSQKTQKTKLK